MLPLWVPARFCLVLLSAVTMQHCISMQSPTMLHSPSPKHIDSLSVPLAAARGWEDVVSAMKNSPTLFSASFSEMKLKPDTVTAHPIFVSYEGVFLCVESRPIWCYCGEHNQWRLLFHHLALPPKVCIFNQLPQPILTQVLFEPHF